jgi:tetratricopeptide (TPR) repeat protein
MRRATSMLLALLCLLACAQIAVAKDEWISVRSKNFFLVGNANEKEIKQVANRLEQFREVFRHLFREVNFDSPVPTTVVVFKNDGAYKPFKPVVEGKIRDVAGYFQSGEDVNYITLTPPRGGGEDPYRTIYHEYVHLLVANNLGAGTVPPWFNEGLAEYYSTFTVDDARKVRLGDLIDNHIFLLRQTKMPPLKTLFELDYYSLHRNRSEARSVFYAQAWALVHYIIQSNNGARLPQMNRFLELTAAGRSVEQAFVEAFQTDLAVMEKELKNYVNGNSFRAHVATFKNKLEFDAEMQAAPLTEAEVDAYLGDLLLHTHRLEEAATRLQKAIAADPKLGMAHASLGLVRVRQRRFDEAGRHLREAIAADSRNYLAHYYYAYALSREGMDQFERVLGYPSEKVREMRSSLERAAQLKPDFPETYHLLAFLNLVTGEGLDDGIKLINRARSLAPGNEGYAFILAQLYMKKEDFAAALRTAEQLARDASDPQLRANAQSLAASIKEYGEQVARYKAERERAERERTEMGAVPTSEGPPRLRRDPAAGMEGGGKSEDELAEEAMMSAIRDALRRPTEGETRLVGRLASIDCDRQGVTFIVRAGDRTLRLSGGNFQNIQLTSFAAETFAGTIGCEPYKGEGTVVITFRPATGRAKIDGSAVALEFVPAKFRLEP